MRIVLMELITAMSHLGQFSPETASRPCRQHSDVSRANSVNYGSPPAVGNHLFASVRNRIRIDAKFLNRFSCSPMILQQWQRFLKVGGTPVIYILSRKTLEILGSFTTGSPQADPPGHLIGADHKGNVYAFRQ